MNAHELAFQQRMAERCLEHFAGEAWLAVSRADDPYTAIAALSHCHRLSGAAHAMSWTDVGNEELVEFWRDVAVDWILYCTELRYQDVT